MPTLHRNYHTSFGTSLVSELHGKGGKKSKPLKLPPGLDLFNLTMKLQCHPDTVPYTVVED